MGAKKHRRRPPQLKGWLAKAQRASLIHFMFWIWVIGQAILSRGILMVCWVEPSAQKSQHNSNQPNHKKPAELNSFLFWLARNLRVLWAEPPRTAWSIVCGSWGRYLYPLLSPHSLFQLELKLFLSPFLVLQHPLLKSWWLPEGFGLCELEKAREDPSPPFLCTWWIPNRLVCSLLLELGS
jgi:hypothetical protein